jgi:hypothetical protein
MANVAPHAASGGSMKPFHLRCSPAQPARIVTTTPHQTKESTDGRRR